MRLGVDLEHAGDPRVERLDALEVELGGSQRGELAALEAAPELGDADLEQLEVAAGHAGRLRRGRPPARSPDGSCPLTPRARAGARHHCRAAQRAEMEEAPPIAPRSRPRRLRLAAAARPRIASSPIVVLLYLFHPLGQEAARRSADLRIRQPVNAPVEQVVHEPGGEAESQ